MEGCDVMGCEVKGCDRCQRMRCDGMRCEGMRCDGMRGAACEVLGCEVRGCEVERYNLSYAFFFTLEWLSNEIECMVTNCFYRREIVCASHNEADI